MLHTMMFFCAQHFSCCITRTNDALKVSAQNLMMLLQYVFQLIFCISFLRHIHNSRYFLFEQSFGPDVLRTRSAFQLFNCSAISLCEITFYMANIFSTTL